MNTRLLIPKPRPLATISISNRNLARSRVMEELPVLRRRVAGIDRVLNEQTAILIPEGEFRCLQVLTSFTAL